MVSKKEMKYLGYSFIIAAIVVIIVTFIYVFMIHTPMISGLSETVDCGYDIECFKNHAFLCKKAKVIYVFEGVNGKTEFLYESLGKTQNFCLFKKSLQKVIIDNVEQEFEPMEKICKVPADNVNFRNVLFDISLERQFCS